MSEKNIVEEFYEIMKDVPKEMLDQMCPDCSKMNGCTCTEKMPKWIKCSDRLPEKDKIVLYTDGKNNNIYLGSLNSGMHTEIYWSHYDFLEDTGITHWMPLPEAPKA